MPSFLDIAPLSEPVEIRGLAFEVVALTLEDIARLIYRFPALRSLLPGSAGGAASPAAAPDAETVIGLGKDVCAAIVAYAAGKNSSDEEAAIAGLAVGELYTLIEPILRLSFPGGLVPFVNRLNGLLLGAGAAVSSSLPRAGAGRGKARASSSSSPSTS